MNLDKFFKATVPRFEKHAKYVFKNKKLLLEALTHSSFSNNYKYLKLNSNERLEFLGDSVLSLVISHSLYCKYENYDEGQLSKFRATIVCEQSLAKVAVDYNFGQYLLLGKGEEMTKGRERASILANMSEAIIGAIYLDGGYQNALEFIENFISPMISCCEDIFNCAPFVDYKTILQEKIQKKGTSVHIEYVVVKEIGPDHDKQFFVEVRINDSTIGYGKGKSKKEAEQDAAKTALSGFGGK